MHIKFRQFFIAAITAVFCTGAFSYSLISIAGDASTQEADNPWAMTGSESSALPLMLASGKMSKASKVKKSKPGSKVKLYYCQIKKKGGSKKSKPISFKAKTKKANSEKKLAKKLKKCQEKYVKNGKYFCKVGKCGPNESFL